MVLPGVVTNCDATMLMAKAYGYTGVRSYIVLHPDTAASRQILPQAVHVMLCTYTTGFISEHGLTNSLATMR
jgi:hypothetical protein